jgi:23S rRNA pseudouridine1911/1915/1917 synthase
MAEPGLRIVHLDDSLAVVEKPAGLVVHPAPSHSGPTLVDELADILGGGEPERPGIVHRLDRGTSGLLVVARDDPTHAALQALVQAREVERVYLALVGGGWARAPARSTPRSGAPLASGTGWRFPEPLRARPEPISRCWSCWPWRAISRRS